MSERLGAAKNRLPNVDRFHPSGVSAKGSGDVWDVCWRLTKHQQHLSDECHSITLWNNIPLSISIWPVTAAISALQVPVHLPTQSGTSIMYVLALSRVHA